MSTAQRAAWEQLTKWHPVPWYLERCNNEGVEVKDCRGETVFSDDFGTIPDEASSGLREQIIGGGRALAVWLVALANERRK